MYRMSKIPLISSKEIQARIQTLAKEISETFEFDIVLSVLTGACMFTTDLVRAMARPSLRIAFIKASSYGSGTTSCGKPSVTGLDRIEIKGKRVLLIDDILDTGHTMNALASILKEKGVADLRTCVLLNKEEGIGLIFPTLPTDTDGVCVLCIVVHIRLCIWPLPVRCSALRCGLVCTRASDRHHQVRQRKRTRRRRREFREEFSFLCKDGYHPWNRVVRR